MYWYHQIKNKFLSFLKSVFGWLVSLLVSCFVKLLNMSAGQVLDFCVSQSFFGLYLTIFCASFFKKYLSDSFFLIWNTFVA